MMSTLVTPSTARELANLGMRYGVGTLFGVFLLYKFTGTFDARLGATELALRELSAQLAQHQVLVERAENDRRANERVMRMMLRGICLGTSGDLPQARALCDIGDSH